jgi:hypothetical protein
MWHGSDVDTIHGRTYTDPPPTSANLVRTLLGTVSGTGLFRRCAEKQLHRSLVLLHVADAERILPGVRVLVCGTITHAMLARGCAFAPKREPRSPTVMNRAAWCGEV